MALNTIKTVETGHTDMIHDAQLDYYGRRLASCSSDRTIRIWEIDENGQQAREPLAVLTGHEGPVWQVSWAHPKFGTILASCSYDRRVIIWKETDGVWGKIFEYDKHELSVNSVAWAPHELGLILASTSSDTNVSVLTYNASSGQWDATVLPAHQIGVNCLAWAPAFQPGFVTDTANNPTAFVKRFASGGCDNLVKIWKFDDAAGSWKCEEELAHHKDWVRDVAFEPNVMLPGYTLASCSQDGTVVIWTKPTSVGSVGGGSTSAQAAAPSWHPFELPKFPDVLWRVSWSLSGSILAVSGGDNVVSLWKEAADGTWECISSLDKDMAASASAAAAPQAAALKAQ